jgi:hypothetical protein
MIRTEGVAGCFKVGEGGEGEGLGGNVAAR